MAPRRINPIVASKINIASSKVSFLSSCPRLVAFPRVEPESSPVVGTFPPCQIPLCHKTSPGYSFGEPKVITSGSGLCRTHCRSLQRCSAENSKRQRLVVGCWMQEHPAVALRTPSSRNYTLVFGSKCGHRPNSAYGVLPLSSQPPRPVISFSECTVHQHM